MGKVKYLPIYFDNEAALSMLSDEERGQLLMALLSAAQGRKVLNLSPAASVAFDFMSKAIARQAIRYKANVENGQKGGAPLGNKNANKGSKINQQLAKTNKKQPTKTMTKTKTNDNGNDNDKNEAVDTFFIPPRIDEIQAYCADRNNSIDAQRFHNFYEAKGWKIGNQPMQDWRAAIRTWEDRDEKQNQTSPKKTQTNNPFKEMLLEEENE